MPQLTAKPLIQQGCVALDPQTPFRISKITRKRLILCSTAWDKKGQIWDQWATTWRDDWFATLEPGMVTRTVCRPERSIGDRSRVN
jgi:hypothetical protein